MPKGDEDTPAIKAASAALYPATASGVLRRFSNASTHLQVKKKKKTH